MNLRKYIKRFVFKSLLGLLLFHIVGLEVSRAQNEKVRFDTTIITGAERLDLYLPLLKGKKIAVVGNQTSVVGDQHLVDTLLALGVNIKKVLALEHGFRGKADAGERIKDSKDPKTGVPIVSLYGRSKKPKPETLEDVDILLFDLQDVGVRFYTYISSMHYIMEGIAESGKQMIILDRPNPNGFYVDGPVLEMEHQSFIGMHPVPIVHGMTIGEFAQMINGEKWLKNGIQCDLKVIPCKNYEHSDYYEVKIKPSPNLPNMASIYLYPSIGLFEGTKISVGRGTDKPFQIIGAPGLEKGNINFTPESRPGAKYPKHKGIACKGYDLEEFGRDQMPLMKEIYLYWLTGMYQQYPNKAAFFKKSGSFYLLCGNKKIRQMVESGKEADAIRKTWKTDVDDFKTIRKNYLLYPDFE